MNYADNIISDESLAQYAEQDDALKTTPQRRSDPQNLPDYRDMTTVADHCAFIRHCRDDADCLSEPEWWSMISILCHGVNGEELCHEYSSAYPKYKIQETQQKIIAAQKENKPHTCTTIKDYGYCPSGGCEKNGEEVNSPIIFAKIDYTSIADWEIDEDELLPANTKPIKKELLAEIKEKSIAERFSDEKLDKLVSIRLINLTDYQDQRAKCLAAAKKYQIHRDVAKRLEKMEKQQLAQQVKSISSWNCNYFQAPDIPERYAVDDDGVYYIDDDGQKLKIIATPVGITKKMRNINNHKTRCELTYRNFGKIVTKAYAPSELKYGSIMALNDFNIPIANQYAKLASDYLLLMNGSNKIPVLEEADRYGWNNDYSKFIPYTKDIEVAEQMKTMNDKIESIGDYEQWKTAMHLFRQSPTHRFALACGFAAPLYKPLAERIPVFMFWGEKDAGKSISMESLTSIWGNPKAFCHTPNDSPTYIYRKAAVYNNIPLVMDELGTILNNAEKIKDFKSVIYQLTQGQDPGRARKEERETREMNEWCTCIVVAGERGILSPEDFGGIQKRVVEIQISSELKKTNEKILSTVKKATEKNYGHAGREYIKEIIPLISHGEIHELRQRVVEQIEKLAGEAKYYYTDVVSVVLLADYLASIHIFEQDEDTAWTEMQNMFMAIFKQYEKFDSDTEADNKYNVLINWLEKNQHSFDGRSSVAVNGYFIDANGNKEKTDTGFANRTEFTEAAGVVILSAVLRDFAEKQYQWGYKRLLTDLRKLGVLMDGDRVVVEAKQQRVVKIKINH